MVDAALHPDTVDVGVALEAGWAAAGRLVVGRVALGVAGTRVVGHTGIQALPVCADFRIFTLTVRTASNRHTSNFRVASEADGTEADGLVVVDVALGVGSTVAWVHAVPVVAGLSLRAVIVRLATNHNNRLCA